MDKRFKNEQFNKGEISPQVFGQEIIDNANDNILSGVAIAMVDKDGHIMFREWNDKKNKLAFNSLLGASARLPMFMGNVVFRDEMIDE